MIREYVPLAEASLCSFDILDCSWWTESFVKHDFPDGVHDVRLHGYALIDSLHLHPAVQVIG
jgi:hypothetical protein